MALTRVWGGGGGGGRLGKDDVYILSKKEYSSLFVFVAELMMGECGTNVVWQRQLGEGNNESSSTLLSSWWKRTNALRSGLEMMPLH